MQSPQEAIQLVSRKYQKSSIQIRKRYGPIHSIHYLPSGKQIICAAGNMIMQFDLRQEKLIALRRLEDQIRISLVRYAPNGKFIASANEAKTITIWNACTLNKIGKTFRGHTSVVFSLAFSPDGLNLISGCADDSIILWNIPEQVSESIRVGYWVMALDYSYNGLQFLSAGTNGNIDIWNSKNRQRLFKLDSKLGGPQTNVYKATYSFDDRYIVSGGEDGTIKIWDALTGRKIGNDLVGHENTITSVAFSSDSTLIVSGSVDRTVRLWNFKTGKQESLLHKHRDFVSAVRFSNDGRYILSGASFFNQLLSIIKLSSD